ncbi:response regulator [Niveispirillum cyanobacteriorum]|uniref:response regulator n=1 Tax=Niveispirillum cyanobacteriorum TaxID=1612173 RepID=UPI0019A2C7E5|nr:response regulator [Niveispirillum cyanobacteriorum]GGE45764.1 response regulator [Niveispirillum cyanobacteriorum]
MIPALERILYVEDEEMLRTVTNLALTRIGKFTVELCDSGTKAVEMAKRFKPQLIMLDVMMPVMDGPATLRALQDDPETADIPVIFITAKVQPREVEAFLALGVVDVIAKPFEPMGLAGQVRGVWNRLNGGA